MSAGGGAEGASGASERLLEKAVHQTMRLARSLRFDGRKLAEYEARLHEELFVAWAQQVPAHPRGLIIETDTQEFHLLRGRRGFNLEKDQLNLALSHGRALFRRHPVIESADFRVHYHVVVGDEDVDQRGFHEFSIRRVERKVKRAWQEIYACAEPTDSVNLAQLFLGSSPIVAVAQQFRTIDDFLGQMRRVWQESQAERRTIDEARRSRSRNIARALAYLIIGTLAATGLTEIAHALVSPKIPSPVRLLKKLFGASDAQTPAPSNFSKATQPAANRSSSILEPIVHVRLSRVVERYGLSMGVFSQCMADGRQLVRGGFSGMPSAKTPPRFPMFILRNNRPIRILYSVDEVNQPIDDPVEPNHVFTYRLAHYDAATHGYIASDFGQTIRSRPCVRGNHDPVIDDVGIETSVNTTPPTLTLRAKTHDPDGDPLTFHWEGPACLNFDESGTSPVFTRPLSYSGAYTVYLRVEDGRGGNAFRPVTFGVTAPLPDLSHCEDNEPAAYRARGIVIAQTESAHVGEPVEFRVAPRRSPNGSPPASYRWNFDECREHVNPVSDCFGPPHPEPTVSHRFTVPALYRIQVEITYADGDVETLNASAIFIVDSQGQRVYCPEGCGM
jgi:Big-like domain-containing protein